MDQADDHVTYARRRYPLFASVIIALNVLVYAYWSTALIGDSEIGRIRFVFLGWVLLSALAVISLLTYRVGWDSQSLHLRERTLAFSSIGWPFEQRLTFASITEAVPEFSRADERWLGDHEFSRIVLTFGDRGSFPIIRAWLTAVDFCAVLETVNSARPGLISEYVIRLAANDCPAWAEES